MNKKGLRAIPSSNGIIWRQHYEELRRRSWLVVTAIFSLKPANSFGAENTSIQAATNNLSFSPEFYAILTSATVALVCAIVTLRAHRITQRKILTFNALHESRRDELLTEAMRRLVDMHYANISIKTFASAIPSTLTDPCDKKEWIKNRDAVMYVLSHYETIGAGVALGAYDDRVIYRASYSNVKKTYDACNPYIAEIRQLRHRPELYKEVEGMMTILDAMEKKEKTRAGKKDSVLSRLFS